jgi:hypothetical protein
VRAGRRVARFLLSSLGEDGFSCNIGTLLIFFLICGAADCQHPKTAEDFFKLSPSPKVCLLPPFLATLLVPRGSAQPSSHASSSSEQGKLLRSVSAMLPFAERDANATNLR